MLEQGGYSLKWYFLLAISAGFLLHSVVSQIPLDSKISVQDNNFWVSPNGEFAFGFFNLSDQPNQYSIGIRFNSKSIPVDKQIVVWVVGADLVVGSESYFLLANNGELVLHDSLKGVVWTSKTSLLSVASAALGDNGNLVLLNAKKDIVWNSFDIPTDTLLPGQNLSILQTLRAASKNSMSSYYTLFMNASGQLQLRWESHVIYWTSNSPSISNLTAFFSSDGALQLRDQKWRPVWSVFGEDHNDSIRYRFLRLDVDGNLRLYSWVDASQSWRSVWQAVENQCKVFATCGQHGICLFTASATTDCRCPFGLINGSISSCSIPFQQRCRTMVKYEHTFLYGMYPPTDNSVSQISLLQCKRLCENDPLCRAVTFTNDGTGSCLLKKTQYVSGYMDPSLRSVSFVKKCSDPLAVDLSLVKSPPPPQSLLQVKGGSHKFCVPCLIGAVSGTFAIFIVVHVVIALYIFKIRNCRRKNAALAYKGPNSNGLIVLPFSELKELTQNFEHQIGPTMFQGILPNDQPVAVKDLKATIEERRYRVAVSKIGSISHKNLVKLVGYCCELHHRFLIYEYVKNGSVEKHMEDPKLCKRLTWGKRVDICLNVARAVSYLHSGCREFVNHGNLKCGNVVLDENLDAKVTEFGLERVISETSCSDSSAERDVEDFGKMILTIFSGCKELGEELCEWAYKEWMEGHAMNVLDRRIHCGVDSEEMERIMRIAFWCLQTDGRRRPSMREVVKVLEGKLSVDPPPPPFACQKSLEQEE
ncbi:hypothetical protein FEM48_Zijuj12G0093500 [Ziziphus jujuba var. spinosa]|uniref:Receptor-like serine/threonine-protein kinase n=1 Tax=Ziziphus jujuba var. spinosa TaxID=714518 RepID=A0A978UCH1_ZIZJJ|nr:hypothetical protein FEM48_Zijuj12G0093500 [Ziziphus jujuba var. spinosa]